MADILEMPSQRPLRDLNSFEDPGFKPLWEICNSGYFGEFPETGKAFQRLAELSQYGSGQRHTSTGGLQVPG